MKVTLEDIMKLDCSDESQKEKLIKVIRKIKPFDRYPLDEEIPMDMLEKYMNKAMDKYCFKIGYIFHNNSNIPRCWTISLRDVVGKTYLDTIYAISINELMMKVVIRIYFAIRDKEVKKRKK